MPACGSLVAYFNSEPLDFTSFPNIKVDTIMYVVLINEQIVCEFDDDPTTVS
jgi:hypothetical protein